MAKNENMIPLSWDDQVQASEAKILTPRGPPASKVSQVSAVEACDNRAKSFSDKGTF